MTSLEQISTVMEPAPTLANTPSDLQIAICILLHPSDILALRKTCKVLELATRNRTVWVAALHRVCLDNSLFLPSFPIPDMSDLELERAVMAPRRWIELCASGALQNQDVIESSEMIQPRTRIIKDTVKSVFIVPGGRYLVTAGNGISVWDMGYVSTVGCKLVASVGLGDEFEFCVVQATPDGKGLVILSSDSSGHLSIFEIYPQSDIPLLNRITHLDWFPSEELPAFLLPDILICHVIYQERIVFKVVNYRTNYSTCFLADVDVKMIGQFKILVANLKTIIVMCRPRIFIWAIPSLSPQSSHLPNHFLDDNSTPIPPIFQFGYPGSISRYEILGWMTVSTWYFGSCESAYFDMLFTNSTLKRFEFDIKPDLSNVSLSLTNSYIISNDLMDSISFIRSCGGYKICEDTLVYFWYNRHKSGGAYTGLTFAPLTNIVTRWDFGLVHSPTSAPFANEDTRWDGHINSLCPTSGKSVYSTDDGKGLVVVDLF